MVGMVHMEAVDLYTLFAAIRILYFIIIYISADGIIFL